MLYNWVKAAHLIFVIATMASLMIYPRYKIHQLASQPGEPLFETMKSAANKLLVMACSKCCRTGSGSCARPRRITCRAPMTSMSRPISSVSIPAHR
jgi:hypothetical protein